jgi:hypothetical protein
VDRAAYHDAVSVLRSWLGRTVVVELLPEGTVMRGVLSERDEEGPETALFAVDGERLTGVALALFADGVAAAELTGPTLTIRQGRMTLRVTTCAGRRSGRG